MTYQLSRKAEDDIIDIFRSGLEHFGLEQAERYHSQLENSFQFLANNPYAATERTEISPPVRIHPVGVHLVIYQQEPAGGILIIRVRHQREDWQSQP